MYVGKSLSKIEPSPPTGSEMTTSLYTQALHDLRDRLHKETKESGWEVWVFFINGEFRYYPRLPGLQRRESRRKVTVRLMFRTAHCTPPVTVPCYLLFSATAAAS